MPSITWACASAIHLFVAYFSHAHATALCIRYYIIYEEPCPQGGWGFIFLFFFFFFFLLCFLSFLGTTGLVFFSLFSFWNILAVFGKSFYSETLVFILYFQGGFLPRHQRNSEALLQGKMMDAAHVWQRRNPDLLAVPEVDGLRRALHCT